MPDQKKKKKIVGYGRVSPGGKDISIERQHDAFRFWWNSPLRAQQFPDSEYECDTEANWFSDPYVSGVETVCIKRKGIMKMLRAMDNGDVMVVPVLDRLGRNTVDMLRFIEAIQKVGCRFMALDVPVDTNTPEGKFQINIMASTAQFEAERIKARRMSGLEKIKRCGGTIAQNPSRGWKKQRQYSQEYGGYINVLVPCHVSRGFGKTIANLRDHHKMPWETISEWLVKNRIPLPDRKGTRTNKPKLLSKGTLERWYHAHLQGYPEGGANVQGHHRYVGKRKIEKQKIEKELGTVFTGVHALISPALSVPMQLSEFS